MANTTLDTANVVQQWEAKFFAEYVRDNLFAPYMGTGTNSVIQINEKLGRMAGDQITLSLITRLVGAGVTGDSTLETNEEALGNYGHKITVDQLRNAVSVGMHEQQKSVIDLLNAAREMLKFWMMDTLRDEVIDSLYSPALDNTFYASATEVQKDAWDTANGADRILYGEAVANRVAGDHSASLLAIAAAGGELSEDLVSLAKRKAKTADPHIRPIRTEGGEEWFVMFCNSLAFRDLKSSSKQTNREAWTRGSSNPLFRDGDLLYDGVICREVPEIGVISGVGAAGIDVAANFLCGAQAVGLAYAQRSTVIRDTRDYGNIKGVGVKETRGIDKLFYNDKQHGVVTVYTPAVADA